MKLADWNSPKAVRWRGVALILAAAVIVMGPATNMLWLPLWLVVPLVLYIAIEGAMSFWGAGSAPGRDGDEVMRRG